MEITLILLAAIIVFCVFKSDKIIEFAKKFRDEVINVGKQKWQDAKEEIEMKTADKRKQEMIDLIKSYAANPKRVTELNISYESIKSDLNMVLSQMRDYKRTIDKLEIMQLEQKEYIRQTKSTIYATKSTIYAMSKYIEMITGKAPTEINEVVESIKKEAIESEAKKKFDETVKNKKVELENKTAKWKSMLDDLQKQLQKSANHAWNTNSKNYKDVMAKMELLANEGLIDKDFFKGL